MKMALIDVTYTRNYDISRDDVEKNELFRAFMRSVTEQEFADMTSSIDHVIDDHVNKSGGRLVWESTGSLIGNDGEVPVTQTIWDLITRLVGENKESKMIAGMLIRWVIAGRDENWLMYRQEAGVRGEDGKDIYRSEYWIGEVA